MSTFAEKVLVLLENVHIVTRFVIPGVCTARAAMYEEYRNEDRIWLAYWMGTAVLVALEGSLLGQGLYWFLIDSKKRAMLLSLLRILLTHWMAWLGGGANVYQGMKAWLHEREALIEYHLDTIEKRMASCIAEATVTAKRCALEFASNHAWELWRLAKCYATAKAAATEFYASVQPIAIIQPQEEESLLSRETDDGSDRMNKPPHKKTTEDTSMTPPCEITTPPPLSNVSMTKAKEPNSTATHVETVPPPVSAAAHAKTITHATQETLPPSSQVTLLSHPSMNRNNEEPSVSAIDDTETPTTSFLHTKKTRQENSAPSTTTKKIEAEKEINADHTTEQSNKTSRRQRTVAIPAKPSSIAARVASRHRTSTVSSPRLKAALDRATAPLRRTDKGTSVTVRCRILEEDDEKQEESAATLLIRISGFIVLLYPPSADASLTLMWPPPTSQGRASTSEDELDDFCEEGNTPTRQSRTAVKLQPPLRTPLAAVRFVRRTTKRVRLVYHRHDGTCCLLIFDFATPRAATTHADSFRSLSDKARSRLKAAAASRSRRIQRDAFDAWFLSHLFRPKCLDS